MFIFVLGIESALRGELMCNVPLLLPYASRLASRLNMRLLNRIHHLRKHHSNVSLEPDPFREVLADRTLQELVDKIFPWMKKKEEEEEKAFYEARGIKLKPEYETAESSAKKQKTDEEKSAKDAAMSKASVDLVCVCVLESIRNCILRNNVIPIP